jgi:GrpE protein
MNIPQFTPGIHWGYTLSLVGILCLLVLGLGIALGVRFGRARTRHSAPNPAPQPYPDVRPQLDAVTTQRAALVDGCLKVRGLLEDRVLTGVLDGALDRGGIQIIDPTGTRVDSSQHRIAGTDPAPTPAQDGVISRTLIPGFFDAGRVVRAADVVVYKGGR